MQDRPVVTNNTPLVAFSSISQLELLHKLFGEILIPPAVQEEFTAFEKNTRLQFLQDCDWIQVARLSKPSLVEAYIGLDRGEAEVLALAQERDARLVLIDEKKARRYAQRMGFPISGTIGVLLLAKESGLIQSVTPLLTSIIEAGLFLHEDLIRQVIELANE